MRLKDQVAIITGAAQGIGRCYALRFAQEGATVACADLNEAGAQNVAAECERLGGRAIAVRLDVASEASADAAAVAVHERFGRVDILINNAAIYFDLDRQQNTLEYFNKVMSVNLTGVWIMSRAVERFM